MTVTNTWEKEESVCGRRKRKEHWKEKESLKKGEKKGKRVVRVQRGVRVYWETLTQTGPEEVWRSLGTGKKQRTHARR